MVYRTTLIYENLLRETKENNNLNTVISLVTRVIKNPLLMVNILAEINEMYIVVGALTYTNFFFFVWSWRAKPVQKASNVVPEINPTIAERVSETITYRCGRRINRHRKH